MKSSGNAREAALAESAAASRASLMRTAVLLTGDRRCAEDLVQAALVRVYLKRGRSKLWDSQVGYARKTVVNLHATGRRRSWHGKVLHSAPADCGTHLDLAGQVVAHHQVTAVLGTPPCCQWGLLRLLTSAVRSGRFSRCGPRRRDTTI